MKRQDRYRNIAFILKLIKENKTTMFRPIYQTLNLSGGFMYDLAEQLKSLAKFS